MSEEDVRFDLSGTRRRTALMISSAAPLRPLTKASMYCLSTPPLSMPRMRKIAFSLSCQLNSVSLPSKCGTNARNSCSRSRCEAMYTTCTEAASGLSFLGGGAAAAACASIAARISSCDMFFGCFSSFSPRELVWRTEVEIEAGLEGEVGGAPFPLLLLDALCPLVAVPRLLLRS